ncbi:MAG: YdeI/OmpD-associated family protein [Methylotenera sp.]|nr:YdeI/OmpD-associated family protein [Oligoflexia bacterium]
MDIEEFTSARDFRTWLSKNHDGSEGIWLRIFKKVQGKSFTYADGLDEALCFGWIDGQKKSHDEISWLQKFTPRRSKSGWSKINRDHVARLIRTRKMRAPGLKAVESAKNDGRWDAAYDSPKNATVPEDFLKELKKNGQAHEFFKSLNKANIYSITYRLQTAKKPETRTKRMKLILEMLRRGEKFHE